MVLHPIINKLLLLGFVSTMQQTHVPAGFDLPSALSKARAVLSAGCNGLAGGPPLAFFANDPTVSVGPEPYVVHPETVVTLTWAANTEVVFYADNTFQSAMLGDDSPRLAQPITNAQAITLANQYYTLATGNTPPTTATATPDDMLAGDHSRWAVSYPITCAGVPAASSDCPHMILNAKNGSLIIISAPRLPLPPANTIVAISPDQAQALLATAATASSGIGSVVVGCPPVLEWTCPLFADGYFAYWNADGYASYAANNIGVFTYWQGFYDATSYDPDTSTYDVGVKTFLDATSGAIIGVSIPMTFSSASIAHKAKRSMDPLWDLGVGATTVAVGKNWVSVGDGDISTVGSVTATAALDKLPVAMIGRGRLIWKVRFDAKRGIVYRKVDKHYLAGKPNRPLTLAIEKLISSRGTTSNNE